MKINKKKAGVVAGVVAAATMAIAPAAFATSTVSVGGTTTPIGNVAVTGNVKAPGVGFLTNFGTPTDCTTSTITGYVTRGTVVAGPPAVSTKIGAITNLTFSGCTAAGGLPVVIKKDTKTGAPAEWPIHVVGRPAKGTNLLPIQIQNIAIKMNSTTPAVPSSSNKWACYLKATGTVNGTFNQTTQQIVINTAPAYPINITAYDGASEAAKLVLPSSGPGTCGGTIYTGDTASMNGSFLVSSPGVGGIRY